jgi:hypothetical protein
MRVLNGHIFGLEKGVTAAAEQQFQQELREFFAEGICQLFCQWNACLSTYRDNPHIHLKPV